MAPTSLYAVVGLLAPASGLVASTPTLGAVSPVAARRATDVVMIKWPTAPKGDSKGRRPVVQSREDRRRDKLVTGARLPPLATDSTVLQHVRVRRR